jgi:hypothetical protein
MNDNLIQSETSLVTHNPGQETLSALEAYQGQLGLPVFIALIVGILLALLVWAAVEISARDTDYENMQGSLQLQPVNRS